MRVVFFFLLCFALLFPSATRSQDLRPVDSLRNELALAENDDQLVALQLALFKKLSRIHPDSSQLHLKQAVLLSKRTENDSLVGKVIVAQIQDHMLNNRYDSVLHYVELALQKRGSLGPQQLIDTYTMQGTAHFYKSEYAKAIASHLQSEKISSAHEMEQGKAQVFNNIGIAYIKLEDWYNAEEYMNKSLEICKKYDIKRGISYTLGNLGIIYKHLDRYQDAIAAYLESNVICEELGDQRAIARNYNNIGALYEKEGNYDLALEYYTRCFNTSEAEQYESTLTSVLHNLGNLYSKQKRYTLSIDNFEKSLEIAKALDYRDVVLNNYLGLAETYEKIGALSKAIAHRKLYEKWKDSIVNEEHLKNVSELEIKYATEKKEKDILALSQQKLKDEAAMAKQNLKIRRLSLGLLGAILLFGSIFVIFRQYSKNRKQKELIGAIADTQIAERKRISQDLHDSVGGSLALTKNKLLSLYEKDQGKSKELEDSLQTLTRTSEQVRQISHNLMPGELVKFGLVSAIQTTLDQLQDTELKAQLYVHDMEGRIDPTKEIHLFRTLQEIIQNVIKHAKASQLNIYLNRHRKHLNLMVEDDGLGMETDTPSGMGLSNIKSRVAFLKGTVDIDSVLGKGTTMNILIPL